MKFINFFSRQQLREEKSHKQAIHKLIRESFVKQMNARAKKLERKKIDKNQLLEQKMKIKKRREDFKAFRQFGKETIQMRQNMLDKEFSMFLKVAQAEAQSKQLETALDEKEKQILKMSVFVESVKRDPIGAMWNTTRVSAESLKKAELMLEKVQILEKENQTLRKKNYALKFREGLDG